MGERKFTPPEAIQDLPEKDKEKKAGELLKKHRKEIFEAGGIKQVENDKEAEKTKIGSTAEFRHALEGGRLSEAEEYLNKEKQSPSKEGHDQRWVDHRERELFQAYYKKEDWKGAKRVVESSLFEHSKQGRQKRLEGLSGIKYEEI
ncbi:MAG: hypothetical protein ABIJ91_02205 [Candidatus Kuenenbacteria bacterium]